MGDNFRRLFDRMGDAGLVAVAENVVAANASAATLFDTTIAALIGRSVAELVDGSGFPIGVEIDIDTIADWGGAEAELILLKRPGTMSAATAIVDLDDSLRPNKAFTEVSLQLATATAADLDATITSILGRIARIEEADRAYVIEFEDDAQLLTCTFEWCAEGFEPQRSYVQQLSSADFAWSVGKLRRGEVLHIPRLDDLPVEGAAEQESFGLYGVKSVLQVPMMAAGEVLGLVGFNSMSQSKTWTHETIDLVRGICDATATALTRRRALAATEEARVVAEQANLAKTQFLSRMSHELRTPLNAVLGFTELMMFDQERTERDRSSLQQVFESGRHLLGLVEDVLDISRIESGRMSMSVEAVDLWATVGSARQMISSAGFDEGLDLQINDGAPAPPVAADRQRLQQVVVNLLTNACKYNRVGGTVTVTVREGTGETTRLLIADTGIGIPPDLLSRVFEPFDRLGREEGTVEGTGIGLTLTKMIVELMGGRIWLDSVPDEGTTVTVELPLARGLVNDTEQRPASEPSSGSRMVLGVEDNEGSRLLLQQVIEAEPGLSFLSASTVREARELVVLHQPGLVLLDLHLADGSGEDLLTTMRADRDLRRIPVVVVTADADPTVMERVIAGGAMDFLPKPLAIKRLREVVRKFLPEDPND